MMMIMGTGHREQGTGHNFEKAMIKSDAYFAYNVASQYGTLISNSLCYIFCNTQCECGLLILKTLYSAQYMFLKGIKTKKMHSHAFITLVDCNEFVCFTKAA